MIRITQYKLPHIYKDAAGLEDSAYRNLMIAATGCSTITDRRFTQAKFERAMAALETTLFIRVAAGQVPNPIGKSRWVRSEHYWRDKLPADGMITSRQLHRIHELWDKLCCYLPEGKRSIGYLTAIIHKATGRYENSYGTLTMKEADNLIDALQDRLNYAEQEKSATQEQEAIHAYA